MKLYLTSLLLLFGLLASAQSNQPKIEQRIDSIFKNYAIKTGPGVAVMIIKDQQVIFKKGYGMANLEYDEPITPASVFDIASVSKQFTGYAISTLIQQGKLSEDDDIHKYLPDVPQYTHKITIHNLIHHTSGIRDWPMTLNLAGWRYDEDFLFDDIMRMVKHQKDLDFEPGSKFSYSNTGYNLLAEIVGKASGKPFPQWVKENIFNPLNMNSSLVMSDHQKVVKHLAASYYGNGDGAGKINDALIAYGSSSIYTNTEDLAKWVIFFQKGIEAKDPVIERMLQTDVLTNKEKNTYAYGLFVDDNDHGLHSISHDGGWAGYRTLIKNYPDEKFSIILLSNAADFNVDAGGLEVAKAFLGGKIKPGPQREDLQNVATVKVDEKQLQKYTGSYQLGTGWYVTFTVENGNLMVQANGEDKFSTAAKSDSVFWVQGYGSSFTFRDIKDKAYTAKYRNIIAKRIVPITVETDQLNDYAGRYHSEELETDYKITLNNGKLTIYQIRLGDIPLDPDLAISDQFSTRIGSISFTRDTQGKVNGLNVSGGRPKNIRFFKM
ncbi:MAG: serine hydrolase [Mucilaginibacter sp.]|nr:serine hydrolase [Mucilaginibacter sp.]